MASVAITLDTVVLAGFESSPVAADAGGNYIQNDGEYKGRIFLMVTNGATVADVTIDSVTPCDQGSDHNEVVTCTANKTMLIGPFSPARFNSTDGRVEMTWSNVTTVTVEAFVVPFV